MTWFVGPTRVQTPNGKSISSAVFAQLAAESPSPYILQWAAPSPPPQNCPFAWEDTDPVYYMVLLESTRINIPVGFSVGSAVLQGSRSCRFVTTDRQTDR